MCNGRDELISGYRRERLALLRRISELECLVAEKNAVWDGVDRRDGGERLVCRYCGLPLSGRVPDGAVDV